MADKDIIKKIKDAVNIVDVVGEQVVLKKAGARYKGLSPFNKEKSPSFFVNPDAQIFHCFSTNQGGDVIDFIRLTKGMSFPEAVEDLARRVGIKIQHKAKSPEEAERDRKLEEEQKIYFKMNRYAAHFYQAQLAAPIGAIARDYVVKRALKRETQDAFLVGFAPDAWTALRDYFISVKAPLIKAVELGLLRTKDGEPAREDGANLYDTFRNRLMFPIRNAHGEVVGFGGRWLGSDGAEVAKYMNSPESPVYNKGKILYNLDRSRKNIREQETVVIVEGYMDCIALDQAAIPYVVATCGTALTPQHVKVLRGLAPRIVCLYDSDTAGQKATERNMDLFLEEEGYPILGASVPNGKDPDEFLREAGSGGSAIMEEVIKNSPALIDLWIEKVLQNTPKALQSRSESLEKIATKLAFLSEDLWIRARIPMVAQALEFDQRLVGDAIRKARSGNKQSSFSGGVVNQSSRDVNAKAAPNFSNNAENKIVHAAEKTKKNQERSGTSDFGFERQFLTELLKTPLWISRLRQMHATDPGTVMPLVGDEVVGFVLQNLLAPLAVGEDEKHRLLALVDQVRENDTLRNMIAEANLQGEAGDSSEDHLLAALKRLREKSVKRKTKILKVEIQKADAIGDHEKREKYQRELNEMIRGLKL